ncbi:TIGR04053 family radical SAM/SPASM domain-containing protein [Vulcanisaeta souniana]|uniref:Radical SAM protein n=1 Tax=Vulcanisaeta souniana JCM 11219 TaxID=1293586 RepID=A0A830E8U0_9CREN|nr:TIGR04053 family radical SAM/SPASM domain-containing protein [Vulcanisaeta souniana]BDR92565.1 radical SAM protein [Vulcanisaeta souniana JCM 11219]GGI82895.1 radical SAM protein [Vulcanisaeta souniana JCM 11219]
MRKWPLKEKPLLVFYETTKACPLACRHCRANALLKPLPTELSTRDAMKFIDDLTGFDRPYPVLILTGGDPLMRDDAFEIMDHAKSMGIPIALSPAVSTKLLNEDLLRELKKRVSSMSISLDGARPETHNYIRRTALEQIDVFKATLEVFDILRKLDIEFQVNTAVMKLNVHELPYIFKIVKESGANAWEVFFLIRVGRGMELEPLDPWESEDVVQFLYEASLYGLQVRTVEAPFFRRIIMQRRSGMNYAGGKLYQELTSKLREIMGEPPTGTKVSSFTPTRDGYGIIFVASDGSIYPSGFLPLTLGNVRKDNIVKVYKEHPVLRTIREARFNGKCGVCEFRDICGGSRARAYTELGDPLASDPACVYEPTAK